jgi:hypothetical protein
MPKKTPKIIDYTFQAKRIGDEFFDIIERIDLSSKVKKSIVASRVMFNKFVESKLRYLETVSPEFELFYYPLVVHEILCVLFGSAYQNVFEKEPRESLIRGLMHVIWLNTASEKRVQQIARQFIDESLCIFSIPIQAHVSRLSLYESAATSLVVRIREKLPITCRLSKEQRVEEERLLIWECFQVLFGRDLPLIFDQPYINFLTKKYQGLISSPDMGKY